MYNTNISGVVSGKVVSGEFFTKNKTDMDKVIDFLDVSLDNYFSSQDQFPLDSLLEESKKILRIITKTKNTNLINIFSNLDNSINHQKQLLDCEAPYTQEEEKFDMEVLESGLHPISHDNVRVNYDKSDVDEFIQVAKDNLNVLFPSSENVLFPSSEDESSESEDESSEDENRRSYLNILCLSDNPNFDEKTLSNYIKDLTKLMDLYRSGWKEINNTKLKQIRLGAGAKDITTAHINIPESQYKIILADLQYRLDNKIFSEVQTTAQTPIKVSVQIEQLEKSRSGLSHITANLKADKKDKELEFKAFKLKGPLKDELTQRTGQLFRNKEVRYAADCAKQAMRESSKAKELGAGFYASITKKEITKKEQPEESNLISCTIC